MRGAAVKTHITFRTFPKEGLGEINAYVPESALAGTCNELDRKLAPIQRLYPLLWLHWLRRGGLMVRVHIKATTTEESRLGAQELGERLQVALGSQFVLKSIEPERTTRIARK